MTGVRRGKSNSGASARKGTGVEPQRIKRFFVLCIVLVDGRLVYCGIMCFYFCQDRAVGVLKDRDPDLRIECSCRVFSPCSYMINFKSEG